MYDPVKPYKHRILKEIKSTWRTPYVKVSSGLYPIIEKKFSFPEIQHTDGIGTKGMYHWKQRTFKNAVLDALAMNLNDLAMVGAVPYALQNHITLPKDDHRAILEIVSNLSQECRKRKIAMTGGETSIYGGTHGMDLSITLSGFLPKMFRNQCQVGDVLIGVKSNGLHSNGITKVREVFGTKYRKEFTEPTRIYLDEILRLLRQCRVHGMMHITGGAFAKLKDILDGSDAVVHQPAKLKPQRIFQELYKRGVDSKKMYTTFNCGIGFVISLPQREVRNALVIVTGAEVIGSVAKGKNRVLVVSAFDQKQISL